MHMNNKKQHKPGDVVYGWCPFQEIINEDKRPSTSDKTNNWKERPMLVIGTLEDTNEILVCKISSVEKRREQNRYGSFPLKDSRAAGLNRESTIMPEHMTIIPKSDISMTFGKIPADELQKAMSFALIQRTLSDMGKTAPEAGKRREPRNIPVNAPAAQEKERSGAPEYV